MAVNLLGASNARVDYGDIAALNGLTTLSLGLVFKATASTASDLRLVTQWGSGGNAFVLGTVDTDELGFVVSNGGGVFFGRKTTGLNLSNGSTYRIIVTITYGSPPTIHIWVNGTDQAVAEWVSSGDVNALLNSSEAVQVGHETADAIDGADGDYAEFAMWNVIVPDANIANITGANHYAADCGYSTGLFFYAPMTDTSTLDDEIGLVTGTNSSGTNATHPDVDGACGGGGGGSSCARMTKRRGLLGLGL